jgi:vancomycin resistance protein YoaR
MEPRVRRAGTRASIGIAAVLAVLIGVFLVDSAVSSGETRRNIRVAGREVGGLDDAELHATLEDLDGAWASNAVTVRTPTGDQEATAAELGVSVDVDATVAAVWAVGDDTSVFGAPFAWIGSFFDTTDVPLSFQVDRAVLAAATDPLVVANRVDPVEPELMVTDGVVTIVPGIPGAGLSPEDVAEAIESTATETQLGAIEVSVDPRTIAAVHTDAEAQVVAATANELTDEPLELLVGGTAAAFSPETMRQWMRAVPAADGALGLQIDPAAVAADVDATVGDVGAAPVELSWQVQGDGSVTYTPGAPGTTCCADDTSDRVITALQTGEPSVELALVERPPEHDAAWADSMQITQQIASFTTNHACCQNRVSNIQRMADMVRGTVIPPGETFSINETVGRRTTAKGFLEDGVIYNGKLTKDVGGGVSQFATTMFNAAFFGGLDIDEYQMHTLYISRYPYGREATLSFPAPDLKITNTTPYGVLIWPTYTPTSITVTLYSTPWVTGEQTGQSKGSRGNCTRVTTERTRTWLADGRTETDQFYANYQPADGVLC